MQQGSHPGLHLLMCAADTARNRSCTTEVDVSKVRRKVNTIVTDSMSQPQPHLNRPSGRNNILLRLLSTRNDAESSSNDSFRVH